MVGDERDRVGQIYDARRAGEDAPSSYVLHALREDGSNWWAENRVEDVIWDGEPAVLIAIDDVTQRYEEAGARRREQANFRELLEQSNLGVAIRRDDKFVFANQAYADIFGYETADEIRALSSVLELFGPDGREHIREIVQRKDSGYDRVESYEIRGQRQDGTPIWVENRVQRIQWEGQAASLTFAADIGDRKRADDELRRSELRFRSIVEGSLQGVLIHRNMEVLFVNEESARILGYESVAESQAAGSLEQHLHPDERARMRAYGEARLRGEPVPSSYDVRVIKKDGSVATLETRVILVEWDGEPVIQTVFYDITDRKTAEDALRISEARFRDFAESASDWFWETDEHHCFTYLVSDSLTDAGTQLPPALGKTRFDGRLSGDQDDAKWVRHRKDLDARRPIHGFEYERAGANGDARLITINGNPIYDDDGDFIGYRGTGRDITESRRRELEIRRSDRRFRDLIDGSNQGILVHRYDELIFANQALCEMLGYNNPDEILSLGSVDAWLPGDERRRIRGYAEARLRGETPPANYEFRALRKDGSEVWLENHSVMLEWDGETTVLGAFNNIDARKQAEAKLKASEQRFRNLVEGSIQGIVVHRNHKVLLANQAMAEILGYEGPEPLYELDSIDEYVHPDDIERTRTYRSRRAAGEEAPKDYELQILRQDGSICWVECRAKVVDWEAEPAIQTIFSDISERKRAEQALRESEHLYRSIIDSMQDTYYRADHDGRITMVSPSVTELLGYSVEEFLGIGIPGLYADHIEYEQFLKDFRNSNGALRDYVAKIRRKDGSAIVSSTNVSYLKDEAGTVIGVEGTARDMTRRAETEEALRRSEARFRRLLGEAAVGISIRQGDNFVYANQALADILGYSRPDDILRLDPIDDFVSSADRPRLEQIRKDRDSGAGAPDSYAYRGMRRDQSIVWMEQTVQEIAWDGSVAYLSFLSDISERKALEEQLQKSHEQLEDRVRERTEELRAEVNERRQAEERAEKASGAKSEFLSLMSHELRTPLNAVLGFSQLLKAYPDQPLTDAQEEQVDQILNGGEHLLSLVNQVLDLSRIETGMLDLSLEAVNPVDAMKEAVRLIGPMANQRGIDITAPTPADASLRVYADPVRLKQVLVNFLSNAVKYNVENGTVTAGIELCSQHMLRFTIRDTGLGIPQDQFDDIFTPFSRLKLEKVTVEGTGIGLAICKQLVEMMSGRVGLESDVGIGSTFWFELPLVRPEA